MIWYWYLIIVASLITVNNLGMIFHTHQLTYVDERHKTKNYLWYWLSGVWLLILSIYSFIYVIIKKIINRIKKGLK